MAGGSYVGLDIGSKYIKVLEARGSGGRVEVTALDYEPTPPDTFDGSMVLDPQLLGQTIKNLLRRAGVSSKQTVCGANSISSVVVRVIDMPQVDDNELSQQMKWETERQVPFARSDIIMDFKRIDRPEGTQPGQNIEVLLAVAQQEYIDREVDALFAAGLNPKYIDVVPLAMGRALLEVGAGSHPTGHTSLIMNIGANSTDISIFRDNILVFPRTIPTGGDFFTRSIAEALQVDTETAERYKCDLAEVMYEQMPMQNDYAGSGSGGYSGQESGGFIDFTAPPSTSSGPISSPSGRMPFDFSSTTGEIPAPPSGPFDFSAEIHEGEPVTPPATEPGSEAPSTTAKTSLPVQVPAVNPAHETMKIQIFNAIAPLLTEIVQELRRSLDFYRSRSGDAPINEVILAGGVARLKKLAPFIEAELGIPTHVANPLQNVVMSSSKQKYNLEEVGPMFALSLGLATYDLLPSGSSKKK